VDARLWWVDRSAKTSAVVDGSRLDLVWRRRGCKVGWWDVGTAAVEGEAGGASSDAGLCVGLQAATIVLGEGCSSDVWRGVT